MDVKTLNELLARGDVKRGRAGPLDFAWFEKVFPKSRLTALCETPFEARAVTGMTVEQFLLSSPTSLHYENEP